jgi:hypothetical protein
VREIRLCLTQPLALFLCPLALGHVHQETHELAGLAGRFENRMTDGLNVSRRTVRENDSVMHVDILPCAACALESFGYQGAIARMNTLMKVFERRLTVRVETIYAGMFVGRVADLPSYDIARPAACVR